MIPILNSLGNDVEKIVETFTHKEKYYQVKELINGESLDSWLFTHENYAVRKSLALMMCDILDSVHRAGIVHQDLKPEQFMVVADSKSDCGSRLILTDFDWSVPHGKVVRHVGTIFYCGIDHEITCKTDIFTLGIILSEMLTGRSPYIFDTLDLDMEEWLQLVRERRCESPLKFCPDNITPEIIAAIFKCLSLEPENRPDLKEIKHALEFDKLKFTPLIKTLFVPCPLIESSVHVHIVKPAERVKRVRMDVNIPFVRFNDICTISPKVSTPRMPDFEPLKITLKEESTFPDILLQKMNNFRKVVVNLIKEKDIKH